MTVASATPTLIKGDKTLAARQSAFLRFVEERDRIRQKKIKHEPRPWTKDPILQEGHFCNVRRADDRVTIWIGEWAKRWTVQQNRWFAYAVARWFNEPKTLEQFPPLDRRGFRPAPFAEVCRKITAEGASVFRGSYIINGGRPGVLKYESVLEETLLPLWKNPPLIVRDSIHGSWLNLREYRGMGSFMSGQIVADWETFGIIKGKDRNTWAPLGPGSQRGLQWIYGLNKPIRQEDAVRYMIQLRSLLTPLMADGRIPNLSLHDVQNCLCEMSKYVRGYAKIRYVPYQESFL